MSEIAGQTAFVRCHRRWSRVVLLRLHAVRARLEQAYEIEHHVDTDGISS